MCVGQKVKTPQDQTLNALEDGNEVAERLSSSTSVSTTPTEKRQIDMVAGALGISSSSLLRRLALESSLFRYMIEKSIETNPILRELSGNGNGNGNNHR